MLKRTLALALLSAAGLAGCGINSQVPLAETYPYSTQKKMQAAHHWEVLADDVAARILDAIAAEGLEGEPLALACSSRACGPGAAERPEAYKDLPFNRGFRSLLLTKLVERGALVQQGDAGALTVSFDAQVLKHHDRGYIRPVPGTYTALAAGLWVVHNVAAYAEQTKSFGAAAAGLAIAADIGTGHIVDTPDQEVIINVSLMSGNRYVFRKTGIYYVNDGDNIHYEPDPRCELVKTRVVPVVSE